MQKPVILAPDLKWGFIVQTDASDLGVGVILAQRTKGEEHPILYLSRKFSDPEKRYSATEKECAAIIFAIKKLRYSQSKLITTLWFGSKLMRETIPD